MRLRDIWPWLMSEFRWRVLGKRYEKLSLPQPPVHLSIRLTPLQHEEDNPNHLVSHHRHGVLLTLPPRMSLVEASKPGVMFPRDVGALDHQPAYPPVPRTTQTADAGLLSGLPAPR